MKRVLRISAALAALLFGLGFAHSQEAAKSAPPSPAASADVKVIEVSARRYEYTPGEIHVKKGTRVQLKIHALDHTHGFKIRLFPEGAPESGTPGLRFDPQQDSFKIAKEQDRVIEFVAERAGTYPFKCSVFCGMGHGGMKGKLVVEG